jgi:hypothetical protein
MRFRVLKESFDHKSTLNEANIFQKLGPNKELHYLNAFNEILQKHGFKSIKDTAEFGNKFSLILKRAYDNAKKQIEKSDSTVRRKITGLENLHKYIEGIKKKKLKGKEILDFAALLRTIATEIRDAYSTKEIARYENVLKAFMNHKDSKPFGVDWLVKYIEAPIQMAFSGVDALDIKKDNKNNDKRQKLADRNKTAKSAEAVDKYTTAIEKGNIKSDDLAKFMLSQLSDAQISQIEKAFKLKTTNK